MRIVRKQKQVLARREAVGELHLMGMTSTVIAAKLGVSRRTVDRDLRAVMEAWRAARTEIIERARVRELASLQLLEREAWAGWQRSLEQGVSEKLSKAEDETTGAAGNGELRRGGKGGVKKRAERTTRTQHGDPRFLMLVMRCVERRARLLDGEAPSEEFMLGARTSIGEALDELSGNEDFLEFCRARTGGELVEASLPDDS